MVCQAAKIRSLQEISCHLFIFGKARQAAERAAGSYSGATDTGGMETRGHAVRRFQARIVGRF